MIPIPLAIAAASSLYQGYEAYRQNKMAEDLRSTERPERKVPESAIRALEMATVEAYRNTLPGATQIRSNQREANADAVRRMKDSGLSSSSINAGIQEMQASEAENIRQLGVESARYRAGAMNRLEDINMDVARYEDAAWQWNEGDPYLRDQEAAAALQGASMQNTFGAINNMADMSMQYYWMNRLYGGAKQPQTRIGNNTPPRVSNQSQGLLPPPQEFLNPEDYTMMR